jgi:hypothetical protein
LCRIRAKFTPGSASVFIIKSLVLFQPNILQRTLASLAYFSDSLLMRLLKMDLRIPGELTAVRQLIQARKDRQMPCSVAQAVRAEQALYFVGPGWGNALSVATSTASSRVLKDSL